MLLRRFNKNCCRCLYESNKRVEAKDPTKTRQAAKARTAAYRARLRQRHGVSDFTLRKTRDPAIRIVANLRRRLLNVVSAEKKSANTMVQLGCSRSFLLRHLKHQFLPGMTWDNYGEWHIDHIRPCASFDLTDPEQQKQCFHYTNLQPLWAVDNLRKGASVDPNAGAASRPAA